MNSFHREILDQIEALSAEPVNDPFLDNYLGTDHPRYAIRAPQLRSITRGWVSKHRKDVHMAEFVKLIDSMIKAKTFTEKIAAGMLLYFSKREWRGFDPSLFDNWLTHLKGWAEVDSLCTGPFSASEVPGRFAEWKKVLTNFAKSESIEKRRASLVLTVSPLGKEANEALLKLAFQNIHKLKHEREVMITRAISWVLRSAIRYHKKEVGNFVKLNADSLPKIAVRETLVKLKTGTKTKRKTT